MKNRLIELLKTPHKAEWLRQRGYDIGQYEEDCIETMTADLLLANGVIVQAQGEWVDQYKGKYANALYKCSVCGEAAYGNGKVWFLSKFCPHCGSKMKGEKSEQAD